MPIKFKNTITEDKKSAEQEKREFSPLDRPILIINEFGSDEICLRTYTNRRDRINESLEYCRKNELNTGALEDELKDVQEKIDIICKNLNINTDGE